MSQRLAAFALIGLIPAAFNPAPQANARSIAVPLCIGSDSSAKVIIPLLPAGPPSRDGSGCCAKGCHTGSSRKRGGDCCD